MLPKRLSGTESDLGSNVGKTESECTASPKDQPLPFPPSEETERRTQNPWIAEPRIIASVEINRCRHRTLPGTFRQPSGHDH